MIHLPEGLRTPSVTEYTKGTKKKRSQAPGGILFRDLQNASPGPKGSCQQKPRLKGDPSSSKANTIYVTQNLVARES